VSPAKRKSKTKHPIEPVRSAGALELERLITAARPALVASMAGQEGRDAGDVANRALQEADLEAMEERIATLELHLQRRAAVEREPADDDGIVRPGRVVELSFGGRAATRFLVEEVLDVSEDAARGDLDLLTPGSPLGMALAGTRVGETVSVVTPGGTTSVKVVSIELHIARHV
jgi:transcription elongation factor GreA